jgi:hypothetical protein
MSVEAGGSDIAGKQNLYVRPTPGTVTKDFLQHRTTEIKR